MTFSRHITAAALAIIAGGQASSADDLTKEITVEKEIVPQEREATRLTRLPALSLPPVESKRLSWSDRAVAAPLSNDITVLPAASYMASVERSPYRGYIDAGYFPAMQAGVSAGYRFIDSAATRLGAWLQYNGSDYSRRNPWGDKLDYHDHTATVGLGARHYVEGTGTLDASLAYTLAAFNNPLFEPKELSQTANAIDLNAGWAGNIAAVSCHAAVSYGFFNFAKHADTSSPMKSLMENHAVIDLGGNFRAGGGSAGIDMQAGIAGTSNTLTLMTTPDGNAFDCRPEESYSHGYFTITPYYRYSASRWSLKAGVQFYQTWGGDNGFRIAPDVRADWKPSGKFAVYARFTGGNPSLNTISSLFRANHYINPSFAYADSWTQWSIDGGFTVGPFSGAGIEVWGSTGKAKNAVMPVIAGDRQAFTGLYSATDLTTLRYGIAFSYNYRDMASLRIAYEGAPQEFDKGNPGSLDRARHIFSAMLGVTPIAPLDLHLGYTLRSGRAIYELIPRGNLPIGDMVYSKTGLGNASNLELGANYRISDRLTVGVRAENLLNKTWQTVYGIPCKGVTGLAGIGYKF